MLRLIIWLRCVLPESLWQTLRNSFWTRFWESELATQRRIEPNALEIAGSERAMLVESIADCYPFKSLLEVGCAYGQNFDLLCPFFPNANFVGVDIDKERIEAGRGILKTRGISNATLEIEDAQDLSRFDDNSFDLVVSSAFLLYVSPEKILGTLQEMFRVARKKVILLEQHHVEERFMEEEGRKSYWIRDYLGLLGEIVPQGKVRTLRVSNPVWPDEQWAELAHIFECDANG